jgi:hypothetical protein
VSGEHGPSERPVSAEVRAFHDEGGSRLLPLDGVVFEPGDEVRYDGGTMEVVRDYGELGIWLAVPGDWRAGEAFVRDRARVQPVYEPGQLVECLSRRLGSVSDRQWVPGVFRGAGSQEHVTISTLYHALHGVTGSQDRPAAEVRPVPAALLREARRWIADNPWEDIAGDDVADLTDVQVAGGIQRHYAGGWVQFTRDAG